jgi:hypothetical protein
MIEKKHRTIEDFIKIKDKCIFCQQFLTPILTNLFGHQIPNIPDIVSCLYNDQFQFRIKYDAFYYSFDANITIDIKDNRFISYYINASANCLDNYVTNAFLSMKPYIELVCENKECRMGYYLQSSFVTMDDNRTIKQITLLSENFILDKWLVSNYSDYYKYSNINHYTWIYPRTHSSDPGNGISCPHLDFETIPKDKLINKIRTIVNFS